MRPPPSDIDPEAHRLIRHKTRRLIGRFGFTATDAEDLSQELSLHAHLSKPLYTPAYGSLTTFYDRVLGRKVCDLIRRHMAAKRGRSASRVPDADVPGPENLHHLPLKLDVRMALSTLPAALLALALGLRDGGETEAAATLSLTRGQVRQGRRLLARHLGRAGLRPEAGVVRTRDGRHAHAA